MPEKMPTPIPAAAKRWLVDPTPFYAIDGESISKIAVSPDSNVVAAGCDSGKIIFIDYPSGKELAAIQAHDSPVIEIAALPSRGGAYSIDTEGNLTLDTINPPDSNIVACTAHRPFAAMITPDRKMAVYVAGGWPPDGRIEAVALPDGKKIKVIANLGDALRASLSPDGTKLLMVQPAPPQGWLTKTWELPSFNRLPDTTEDSTSSHVVEAVLQEHAQGRPALYAADLARGRYVEFIPFSGFKIYSTKDDKPLHGLTYSGTPGAAAVVPGDGSILMGTTDGKIVRYTPPD
jgi:WD40 repeat protein